MFCGQCGAKIPDSAQFCPSCGAKVAGSAENGTPNSMAGSTSSLRQTSESASAPGTLSTSAPISTQTSLSSFLASLTPIEKSALLAILAVGLLMAGGTGIAFVKNFGKVTDLMGMYSGSEATLGVLAFACFSAPYFFIPIEALAKIIKHIDSGTMRSQDWKIASAQFATIAAVSLMIACFIAPYVEDNAFHSLITMCLYAFTHSVWPNVSIYAVPCGILAIVCAWLSKSANH